MSVGFMKSVQHFRNLMLNTEPDLDKHSHFLPSLQLITPDTLKNFKMKYVHAVIKILTPQTINYQ